MPPPKLDPVSTVFFLCDVQVKFSELKMPHLPLTPKFNRHQNLRSMVMNMSWLLLERWLDLPK